MWNLNDDLYGNSLPSNRIQNMCCSSDENVFSLLNVEIGCFIHSMFHIVDENFVYLSVSSSNFHSRLPYLNAAAMQKHR